MREQDKHVLFQNDSYYQSVINAVWFGKKMPTKRQYMIENKVIPARRGGAQAQSKDNQQSKAPQLQSIKEQILNIEGIYTDSGLALQREWDEKPNRDLIREQIAAAQTVGDLQ